VLDTNVLLTDLISEKDLAAEVNETERTWRERRKRGEVPPWCRIRRKVFYFRDKIPAWREARMQGRIRQRGAK
jgi:hypothetical protein